MQLSVMTFNLRVQTEVDGNNQWRLRYPAAAKLIAASGAAVIGTQEMTYAMLQDLTAALPQYRWIGEGRDGGQQGEYCAVLYDPSLVEVVAQGHFGLSEKPEQLGWQSWDSACPRMCTWVRFRSVTGASAAGKTHEFLLMNTHLDHISEEARRKGMELIVAKLTELARQELPVVITGDFNAKPDSDAVAVLEAAGMQSVFTQLPDDADSAGATFHAFKGEQAHGDERPIDYIFFTPQRAQATTVEIHRQQIDGRWPSDHYPVQATLQLGKG